MKAQLVPPPRCTSTLPDDLDQDHLVAEVKMDGSRYVMYLGTGVDPYDRQAMNALLSRRVSTVDHKHVDKTANIPHILGRDFPDLAGTVLDGECFHIDFPTTQSIMGSGAEVAIAKQKEVGWITYWAWDVPIFRGIDIRGRPLLERRKVLESVIARIGSEHVRALPQVPGSQADDLFLRVTSKGGEGLVIKDLRLGFGLGWAKWKRSSEVSCFISGFKPGNGKYADTIGAIALSVFDGAIVREVGYASGFDDETRRAIGANPETYMHRVVDLFAQEISKDGRLRHPTFFRWRDDLNDTDCTFEKLRADLKNVRGNRRKDGA